jgi:hypothetical protein
MGQEMRSLGGGVAAAERISGHLDPRTGIGVTGTVAQLRSFTDTIAEQRCGLDIISERIIEVM